jgi:hypothetical protein
VKKDHVAGGGPYDGERGAPPGYRRAFDSDHDEKRIENGCDGNARGIENRQQQDAERAPGD